MINFHDYTNENKTEHNIKWSYISDHPYRISPILEPNTQPFSQTGQMIELCCEYLSVHIQSICKMFMQIY